MKPVSAAIFAVALGFAAPIQAQAAALAFDATALTSTCTAAPQSCAGTVNDLLASMQTGGLSDAELQTNYAALVYYLILIAQDNPGLGLDMGAALNVIFAALPAGEFKNNLAYYVSLVSGGNADQINLMTIYNASDA